jgi:Transposase DDE domain
MFNYRKIRIDTVRTSIMTCPNGQKWRTGCEGRISVTKRRHGLNRCRYKGNDGMKRWVGLGVVADNLINMGRAKKKRATP